MLTLLVRILIQDLEANSKLLLQLILSAAIAGGIDFATADTTTLASHSGFDFGTNNFTIEFWYKWSTNSGYQTL